MIIGNCTEAYIKLVIICKGTEGGVKSVFSCCGIKAVVNLKSVIRCDVTKIGHYNLNNLSLYINIGKYMYNS